MQAGWNAFGGAPLEFGERKHQEMTLETEFFFVSTWSIAFQCKCIFEPSFTGFDSIQGGGHTISFRVSFQ